jgi:integrase
MASVHKLAGREHWCAAITLPDGRRTFWSTKLPHDPVFKRDAECLANFWAELARLAKAGRLTPDRANREAKRAEESIFETVGVGGAKAEARARVLKLLKGTVVAALQDGKAEILRLAGFEREPVPTDVEGFLAYWIKAKETETKPSTLLRYEKIATRFSATLGPKSKQHLSMLTPRDLSEFRDRLARELAIPSVNHALKVVRGALREAVRLELIPSNPAEAVRTLRDRQPRGKRRNITPEELGKLLAAADGEMKGLIMTSYLAGGLRLGDTALLKWSAVDFEKKTLTIVAQKTGATEVKELHPRLARYLLDRPSSDDPNAYVFPESAGRVILPDGSVRVGTLSNRFAALLAKAGLADKQPHDVSKGIGRSGKRRVSELSFHSLRHAAATDLREAGVADSIAAAVVGHRSPAVGQKYVHVGDDAKRGVIRKLKLPRTIKLPKPQA